MLTREIMLRDLAVALRNRTGWPPGFRWNYGRTDTCAIAIGRYLFGRRAFERATLGKFIPFTPMFKIFYYGAGASWRDYVTPLHVALAIDAYLARCYPDAVK